VERAQCDRSTTSGVINLASRRATACSSRSRSLPRNPGGRISPQPQHGDPASRAYVDWRWNCKSSYPAFHGVTIFDCPNTAAKGGTSYPYIDNLKTAIGTSGTPASVGSLMGSAAGPVLAEREHHLTGRQLPREMHEGQQRLRRQQRRHRHVLGWQRRLRGQRDGLDTGTLRVNTANTTASPQRTQPPIVQTPCIGTRARRLPSSTSVTRRRSSRRAGRAPWSAQRVVYGGRSVSFSGNPPIWTAPVEGPFDADLLVGHAVDRDDAQRSSFTITGGAAPASLVSSSPPRRRRSAAGGGSRVSCGHSSSRTS
jgi:hypothetical protein